MFQKKSLGQNFLNDPEALADIIEAGRIGPEDTVLEVGPGEGVLTDTLLAKAGRVIAVEKDDRLIPILSKKFSSAIASGKFELVHADILNFDPSTLSPTCPPSRSESVGSRRVPYTLLGNIPYYITGTFLRKFLEAESQPRSMVLMLQKEVAERIVAADGKESLLSISVKAYGTPKLIRTVDRSLFSPMPKVDSAILAIENISRDFFIDIDEDKFFAIVKEGFAHKRKQLLGKFPQLGEKKREEIANEIGVSRDVRAEALTLSQWKKLYFVLQQA